MSLWTGKKDTGSREEGKRHHCRFTADHPDISSPLQISAVPAAMTGKTDDFRGYDFACKVAGTMYLPMMYQVVCVYEEAVKCRMHRLFFYTDARYALT